MPVLITADVHMTDLPRDEHRWTLFAWLREQAVKHSCEAVLFLGDSTDQKDRHSSILVNRFVHEMRETAKVARVIILKGNHDYYSEDQPFFQFLHDKSVNLHFVNQPSGVYPLGIGKVIFLPSTKNHEKEWEDIDFDKYQYIFAHQTFSGAQTENGTELKGIPPSYFGGYKGRIISGDIHVPQIVSRKPAIEYVGSPYRVRFGDQFEPRVLLLLDDGRQKDLHFPTKNKHLVTLTGLGSQRLDETSLGKVLFDGIINEGDQVKVRVRLRRSEYPEWSAMKKEIAAEAKRKGWELFGIELQPMQEQRVDQEDLIDNNVRRKPDEIMRAHAKANKVPKPLLDAGMSYLTKAQG